MWRKKKNWEKEKGGLVFLWNEMAEKLQWDVTPVKVGYVWLVLPLLQENKKKKKKN